MTDTGPLTKKRMETFDEEVSAKAIDFMERAKKADKPFFLWWNSTKMHVFTHLKEGVAGKTGLGIYADGMVEHDRQVGEMLDKLKELGLDDNTIVMYSTDNGAEAFTWPDGGTTMFRGEKNTPWEGGYRVPCVMRWPGVIKPGTVINEIGAHEDMCATLLAAAGEPDVAEKLLKGHKAMGRDYKVHLDSYNLMPALKGEAAWPRKDFIYWTDDGSVAALRYGNWKISFLKQTAHGLHVWIHAVRGAARADPDQPAHGSVRARAGHRHGLRPLVRRAHVPVRSRRSVRRPVAAELPRVPAAAEAGQLQPRPRDGSGDRSRTRAPTRRSQSRDRLTGSPNGAAGLVFAGRRRCYLASDRPTSMRMTSPLIGSVADAYCIVCPSRSRMAKLARNERKAGMSRGIFLSSADSADRSRNSVESSTAMTRLNTPFPTSSASQSMLVPTSR